MCEAVREGSNQPFGAVVIFLVEYSTAAMQSGGIDRDEKSAGEVGYPRKYSSVKGVLQCGDGGKHGKRAEDLRDIAILGRQVIEGAGELREVWDRGPVVPAHSEEASGLLGALDDDGDGHVNNCGGSAGVRSDAVAAELVAEPDKAAESDVDLSRLNGEASLLETGEHDIKVSKVVVEVRRRSLRDNVINVGEDKLRWKSGKHLVNKALEGGGGTRESLGHALVLEEPEASSEGGLLLRGVVELNLVKAGEEVESGEPVATTLAEGVGDVGKRVVVLGSNFVKGA